MVDVSKRINELMQERGYTQKMLEKECNINPNTFTKMRSGETVGMETITRLCEFFDCDFSDIMSRFQPVSEFDPSTMLLEYKASVLKEGIQKALKEYMESENLTIRDVHEITGLAINTVKAILRDCKVSSKTVVQLKALGADYVALSDRYALEAYQTIGEMKEPCKTKTERRVEVDAVEWGKMSYTKQREFAKGADVVHIIPRPAKMVPRSEFMALLCKVPAGKITRYNDMIDYFKKKYKAERIEIEEDVFVTSPKWKEVPWWREVSTNGMIQDRPLCNCPYELQMAKLKEEGHIIVPCGARNMSNKVENYKDFLFDFGSLE